MQHNDLKGEPALLTKENRECAKAARRESHLEKQIHKQRQVKRFGAPSHRPKDGHRSVDQRSGIGAVDEFVPFDPYKDLWSAMVTLALHPGDPRAHSAEAHRVIGEELQDLRRRGVWDESKVIEMMELLAQVPDAHIADLFSIVGIKNYDGPANEHKWKGRIVLGGHNVREGVGRTRVDLFEQTANHPSSMCAARCAVAFSCLTEGGVVLQSDCDKAYTQSDYDGPPTWVRLPKKWWPKGKGWENMKDPVCPLVKNLYGHPRAGNGWERHADSICRKHGFTPVPEWPSVYWHEEKHVCLVVYVDDLVAAGEETSVRACLKALRQDLEFAEPEPLDKYLGCRHKISKKVITAEAESNSSGAKPGYRSVDQGPKRGKKEVITTVQANMCDYISKACKDFATATNRVLKHVPTPYVPERGLAVVEAREALPGKFGNDAAHYLMTLLYAARMARPELEVAITRLASRVSKWNAECDDRMIRLYDFIHDRIELCIYGSLSTTDNSICEIWAWPDADLAGDKTSIIQKH